MGGYGSTRWPSDYRARMYVESCLPFKIRDLPLREHPTIQATAQWESADTGEIRVTAVEVFPAGTGRTLNIGGRYFLLTPSPRNEWFALCCGRRVRKLYRHPSGTWGCRRCLRLAYASQWINYVDIRRLFRR